MDQLNLYHALVPPETFLIKVSEPSPWFPPRGGKQSKYLEYGYQQNWVPSVALGTLSKPIFSMDSNLECLSPHPTCQSFFSFILFPRIIPFLIYMHDFLQLARPRITRSLDKMTIMTAAVEAAHPALVPSTVINILHTWGHSVFTTALRRRYYHHPDFAEQDTDT